MAFETPNNNNSKSSRGSFFTRRSSYTAETAPLLNSEVEQLPHIDQIRQQRQTSISSDAPDVLSIIASVPFGCNKVETEILQNHEAFLTRPEEDISVFVRTFFNHVVSIEGFASK